MSAHARCLRALTCALLLAAPVRYARADGAAEDPSRARARALGYGGLEAFRQGDYATASARLDEAFQLLRVPSLGLWSARALVKLGKLVEADARYADTESLSVTAADPPIQLASREEAARERRELGPRMPAPSPASGVPTRARHAQADRAADEAARPFWRGAAWVATGVGAAGVVLGAVTYVIGRVRALRTARGGA